MVGKLKPYALVEAEISRVTAMADQLTHVLQEIGYGKNIRNRGLGLLQAIKTETDILGHLIKFGEPDFLEFARRFRVLQDDAAGLSYQIPEQGAQLPIQKVRQLSDVWVQLEVTLAELVHECGRIGNLGGGELISALASIGPQDLAPYQYEFDLDVIRIRHQTPVPEAGDEALVESIRTQVSTLCADLKSVLQRCNLSPSARKTVEEVMDHFEQGQDIIALGLKNQQSRLAIEHYLRDNPEERSATFTAPSAALFSQIEQYVAQFPDWHKFQERVAQSRSMDRDGIDATREILDTLLEVRSNWVTDEVRGTLKWLRSLVDSAVAGSQKHAISVARTLRNFYKAIEERVVAAVKDKVDEEAKALIDKLLADAIAKCKDELEKLASSDPTSTLGAFLRWLKDQFKP